MKSKTEKTASVRAKELYKMVHPEPMFLHDFDHFFNHNYRFHKGWLKLGKFVLDLEKKWAKAKKGRRVRGD